MDHNRINPQITTMTITELLTRTTETVRAIEAPSRSTVEDELAKARGALVMAGVTVVRLSETLKDAVWALDAAFGENADPATREAISHISKILEALGEKR